MVSQLSSLCLVLAHLSDGFSAGQSLPCPGSPGLADDPALFQQVDGDSSSGHPASRAERHLQELAEAGRVAVDAGAGVPEGLHDGVGGQDALLDPPAAGPAQRHQLAQQVVGGLGFAGTTLPRDHHTLVLAVGSARDSLITHWCCLTGREQSPDDTQYALMRPGATEQGSPVVLQGSWLWGPGMALGLA